MSEHLYSDHPYVDRPLVYIAAPYTRPDPVENTHLAIKVANELLDAGLVTPVVPHVSLLWHLVTPRTLGFWYEYDLAILARCDAVYRLPGESIGADREVSFALARGIHVSYDREDLDRWAKWL